MPPIFADCSRELPSSTAAIASSRRACAAFFTRCATRRTSPLVQSDRTTMARPMANDPPFATLNHFTGDLGIPSEPSSLRIGTRRSLSELNLMNGNALIAAMARIRATVLSRGIMNSFATLRSILGTAQRNKKMKAIDIYQQAIKRTFANLYDESPDEVDVTWGNADDTITVHCSH